MTKKGALGYSDNSKFKCLKSDEMMKDVEYAFSFNPREQPYITEGTTEAKRQFYAGLKGPNPFKEWWEQQVTFFTNLMYCEVEIYCEISSGGRFHFHGILTIKDRIKFFAHDIHKMREHGTYEIDKIGEDRNKWVEYVTKMQEDMQEFLWSEIMPATRKRKPDEEILISTYQ